MAHVAPLEDGVVVVVVEALELLHASQSAVHVTPSPEYPVLHTHVPRTQLPLVPHDFAQAPPPSDTTLPAQTQGPKAEPSLAKFWAPAPPVSAVQLTDTPGVHAALAKLEHAAWVAVRSATTPPAINPTSALFILRPLLPRLPPP